MPRKCTSILSLTSALEEMGGQCHAPAALHPRKRPGTHCTVGWMGPRANLADAENLSTTGIRSPDRLTVI